MIDNNIEPLVCDAQDGVEPHWMDLLLKQHGSKPSKPPDPESATVMSAAVDIPSDNPFRSLCNLGFKRLVPIVPHDAVTSSNSSLSKRPGARGKAVGVLGSGGWHGFNWHQHETSEADLESWHAMGAGVGIRTGGGLVALDIDSLDEAWARRVQALAWEMLGPAPRRYGRAPKVLLPYIVRPCDVADVVYRSVHFDDGTAYEPGKGPRVELLAAGRQFVVHGIHPVTGKPYFWSEPLCRPQDLPGVTKADLDAFFDELVEILPHAQAPSSGKTIDRRLVDQGALAGPVAEVERLVALIPNDDADWNGYVRMASAIRASCSDDPHAGLPVFQEWCARWEIGADDPGLNERTYWSVQPPFGVGLPWLESKAGRVTGAVQIDADKWFAADGLVDISHFPPVSGLAKPVDNIGASDLPWIDPREWANQPIPNREWVVANLIPANEVTLLYGDGGVGKTLLMHQYATCAAIGRDWLGQQTRKARVLCFLCEDEAAELQRRQHDINRSLGIDFDDLSDLRLMARKGEENLLATWERSSGPMALTSTWIKLRDQALKFGANVIILDTLADIYAGSEIDRAQVSAFVKGCLWKLAQAIGGSVIALGHPSTSGMTTGTGTSGSGAWNNACRSRLYLQFPDSDKKGKLAAAAPTDMRVLTSMKINYGARGTTFKLRWARGIFEPLMVSSAAAVDANKVSNRIPRTEDAAERAIISVLASHPQERLSTAANSQYFAPKILRILEPADLAAFSTDEVAAALDRLRLRGVVREAEVGRDSSSRKIFGLQVLFDKVSDCAAGD